MLSIIQLVAPSWAALPDGEPAHWSYAVGESRERKRGAEGRRRVKQRTMAKKADRGENKEVQEEIKFSQ